jgi:hypothetical protein
MVGNTAATVTKPAREQKLQYQLEIATSAAWYSTRAKNIFGGLVRDRECINHFILR